MRRRARICDAAGACDDQVLFACDPFFPRQLLKQGFIEAPGRAVIDIFDRGVGMAQAGIAKLIGQSSRGAADSRGAGTSKH